MRRECLTELRQYFTLHELINRLQNQPLVQNHQEAFVPRIAIWNANGLSNMFPFELLQNI